MKTALRSRLTDEEFLRMEGYAAQRLDSLEAAMIAWREKRKTYDEQMRDCFDFREGSASSDSTHPNDIFSKANESFNIVGGFAEFVSAKAQDDIFGSDPFYAMAPEGLSDAVFAARLEKHSQWKLRQSTFRNAAKAAIPIACGINECVLKVRFREELDYFEEEKVILLEGGKPVLTSRNEYIFETDVQQAVDEVTGKPVGPLLVPKDPELDLTGRKTAWGNWYVEQEVVRYRNVDAYPIHFLNFIAPLNVATLEDAPMVGQTFDMEYDDLVAMLGGEENIPADALAQMRSGNVEPKADGTSKPREDGVEQGEARNDDLTTENPTIKLAEVYFKYTVGGRVVRVFGILAREHQKLLHCEYLGRVTPRGMLPFHVVRPFAVQNRWYGRGYFEVFEKAQLFIDRHLNYVSYGNRFHRVAGKFLQRDALHVADDDVDWVLDPEKWQELMPGKSVKDAVQFLEFPDLDDRTMELLGMMIQVIQARSGVAAGMQGQMSELPSNGTATGVEALLSSGSVLGKVPIGEMQRGIESALEQAILMIYSHLDVEETFTYEEGDETIISQITPEEVQNLNIDVRLILTRFRQREQRESAIAAFGVVRDYVNTIPDPYKAAVRPMVVQVVKGYGIDQADEVVPEPLPAPELPEVVGPDGQPIPPEQQAQAQL